MKNKHNNMDKLAKELLKKSALQPLTSDFDDQLMRKIHLTPSPAKLRSNGSNVKKGWIFLFVSVLLMVLSLIIVTEFTGNYQKELDQIFKWTFYGILYGGLVLFIPLVFYHLDTLLKIIYSHEKYPMKMSV